VLWKEEVTPRDIVTQSTSISTAETKVSWLRLMKLPHLTVHQKLGLSCRCPGQPSEYMSRSCVLTFLCSTRVTEGEEATGSL
jgi:hypothetical protein